MALLKKELSEELIIPSTEKVGFDSAPGIEKEINEKKPETERVQEAAKTQVAEAAWHLKKRTPVVRPAVPQVRDELTIKIEKVLEEGLGDSFASLSPIAKQEFKIKGEETANKIRELMSDTKIKVKKIIRLILEWLKILPGINHFFLEQEAKIKTDKILKLKEQAQKR